MYLPGRWNCPNVTNLQLRLASPLVAVIYIALENRRVVNSKAHFVAFKSLMSIFFAIRVFFRMFSFHFKIHEVKAKMSNSAHDNFSVE